MMICYCHKTMISSRNEIIDHETYSVYYNFSKDIGSTGMGEVIWTLINGTTPYMNDWSFRRKVLAVQNGSVLLFDLG